MSLAHLLINPDTPIPAGSVIGDDASAVFDSTLTVYSPDGARCREIVAPVDTRSFHSVIPAEILLDLGIEPLAEGRFNYRDGTILELPIGWARVALPGKAGHSHVALRQRHPANRHRRSHAGGTGPCRRSREQMFRFGRTDSVRANAL